MFCDTHCHIFKEYYENIDDIIENAKKNNVDRLIVASDNYQTSLEVLELIKKYNNVFGCIGLHPENVNEEFDFNIFENLPKKIIAIGEIGLDYYYTKDNKDDQIKLLRKQLKIAEDLNLPVVIHSREATQDTIDVLKDYKVKGIIHSFSGSYETAQIYIKMGYKLGINGVITFKNANLKDVFKRISLDNIVLETDSPYLTPVPYRGQTNEPSHIYDIAKFVSELYSISLDELAEITNKNIRDIFDI